MADEGTYEAPATPVQPEPATPWWEAHRGSSTQSTPAEVTPRGPSALSAPRQAGAGDADGTPPAPGGAAQRGDTSRSVLWKVGLVALIAALLGGVVGGWLTRGSSSSVSVVESGASPGAALLPNGVSVPDLVKRVLPSIVSIDSIGGGSEDQGTGMILSSDGLVLTNNHVIANAASAGGTITVTQSTTANATPKPLATTLVGRDPSNDVALLRITNAKNLSAITMADSDKVEVGDAAVAIGNALGLAAGTPTVTSGIISAMGRTVTAASEDGTGTETLNNLIQTDAAINPGNSGGPLLDSAGHVMGMNTAVAGSDSGQAQNIGFAIPSNRLMALLPELEKGGTINPASGGYMGVEITTLTDALRSQYNLTPAAGALILSVSAGSPADNAGLSQGDVITAINGQKITSADQVITVTKSHKPGDKLKVTVQQGTTSSTKTVTLGSPPSN